MDICKEQKPGQIELEGGQWAACWLY